MIFDCLSRNKDILQLFASKSILKTTRIVPVVSLLQYNDKKESFPLNLKSILLYRLCM